MSDGRRKTNIFLPIIISSCPFLHFFWYICNNRKKSCFLFLMITCNESLLLELLAQINEKLDNLHTKEHEESTDWLSLDEVCERFHLVRNNLKNKRWRDEHNFPYYQCGMGTSVRYNAQKVNEWLSNQSH